MHHEQRRVDDSLAIGRHIRKTIDCLVNRCIGIDISAEVNANRFEIVDDTFAWEMLCTIESHVLQEVRQPILVVLFKDSSYGLCYMKLATLLRLLIMTDVIGQSVL